MWFSLNIEMIERKVLLIFLDEMLKLRYLLRETLDSLAIFVTEFYRVYRVPQHDLNDLVNILCLGLS